MDIQVKVDTQTSHSQDERKNLVQSLVFPESLENSKLIGHLTEDFSYSVDEFHQIKEILKAFPEREDLLKNLEEVPFLKLDQEKKSFQITISDDLTVYSLINVPSAYSKEQLLKELGFEGTGYFSRIYKKYFVWILVNESSNENNVKIEESLKKVHFGDEKLKYDLTSGKNLKKVILKRVTYNKESSELKAHPKAENSLAAGHQEAGSWRKKSNDGEELSGKKFVRNDTNPNTFKRRRFNSDGAAEETVKTDQIFKNEKIVPSKQIKYRYSIKDMADHFNWALNSFQLPPKFVNNIEEICSNSMRKISILEGVGEKRDRSKTMHYQANDFSAFNQKHINLPKNNPLQDINNFDFNNSSNTNSGTYNNHGQHHGGNKGGHHGKGGYNSGYKNKFDFAN